MPVATDTLNESICPFIFILIQLSTNLETLFEELNLEQIKEFYLPTSLQNKLIERSAV